jgi:hypothetical protein
MAAFVSSSRKGSVPNFAHTQISHTVVLLLLSDELWRQVSQLVPCDVYVTLCHSSDRKCGT